MPTGVRGQAELRHVQGLLTKAPADLHARLLKETRGAMVPTQGQVKASAARLPSGYAGIMARAVRVATRVTSAGSSVKGTVRVSARGKQENRDVRSINAGRLRHPLFGRRRARSGKSLMFDTTVRPRFVSDPLAALSRRMSEGAGRAMNDTADTIVRG